jgi:hypothetical protein
MRLIVSIRRIAPKFFKRTPSATFCWLANISAISVVARVSLGERIEFVRLHHLPLPAPAIAHDLRIFPFEREEVGASAQAAGQLCRLADTASKQSIETFQINPLCMV